MYENRTDEVAVQLAWHFQEAGLVAKAIKYLQKAGDVAGRVYAHSEAIDAYRQAVRLSVQHNVGGQELTLLYSSLGRTLELNSQFDEALTNYEEMGSVARQRGDRPMELAALMAQVTLYATPTSLHDPVKGPLLGQETLLLARELGDQAAEAKTLWNLSLSGMWSGRTVEGTAYGEQAAALARQLNLTELQAYALNDLGMLYMTDLNLEQAKRALDEAGNLWRELDNLPMLTDSMGMTCSVLIFAGEYKQAIALSNQAFQISESSNNLWGQSFSRLHVCWAYWSLGRPDQAMIMVNDSLRLGKLAGFVASQVLAGGNLAAIYGNLGAIEQGLDTARQAITIAETHFPHFRCHPLGILAQLHLLAGNLTEAEAVVEQGKKDPYGDAHPAWNMHIHLAEVELALMQGNYDRTITVADYWLSKLRPNKLWFYMPPLLHFKSQALLAMGQGKSAHKNLLEALDIAEAIGASSALWPILFALSQLATEPTEAQRLHQQARDIVETIANMIGDVDLQASFLNLPHIQAVF
jgi:tetratricopeptide (TPR) repeat protein